MFDYWGCFVCLLSMKYPVMWKHQQMTFTSQYQKLTVICSLLTYWRPCIWHGKGNSFLSLLFYCTSAVLSTVIVVVLSVCLSVCLSHCDMISTQEDLRSCCFKDPSIEQCTDFVENRRVSLTARQFSTVNPILNCGKTTQCQKTWVSCEISSRDRCILDGEP